MPVARMRMRPWLEKMIDSNAVSGLMWMDKAKTMFSIPWKHAARHGWELDKDACLFKLWAIHTGKYVEGHSSADPKTWKANFRCAMNSLPDIEEVKDKSINKGQQAVRVYRMLPVSSKCKRSKTKDTKHRNKSPRMKSEGCSELTQSPLLSLVDNSTHCTQENTVDSTEQQEVMSVDDVPDWSASIEIGPDSTNELCRRFEVSPDHSTEYKDSDSEIDEDIIRLCRQMEQDTIWMQKSTDGMAFLHNEVYKSPYSNSSPESQWSDTSSADDVDDLPEYTTLGELPNADEFLASFRNTFCGGLTLPFL